MATTTRSRSTSSRGSNSRSRSTSSSGSDRSSSRKQDDSVLTRAGRTIRDRPYASAAIATGAVTAVAAAAAGAFFFSRSDKSFKETADDLSTKAKDAFDGAKETVSKAARKVTGQQNQHDFAEEALAMKEEGNAGNRPVDPVVKDQLKAGAVAY